MRHADQDAERWDTHAAAYERMFEPLTDAFNHAALALLAPLDGEHLIDIAAGPGGAALIATGQGAHVTAIDFSPAMAARLHARGAGRIQAHQADAAALPFPPATFTRALSSFGITLLPDPAQGAAEMHRVLRPGSRAAIVTWTEPQNYALATHLRDATLAIRGPQSPAPLPPQLRYIDPARLTALMADAGFTHVHIERIEVTLPAPSARALAAALDFAPGMAAMLEGMGPERAAILAYFIDILEAEQGRGPIALPAVAHIATATRPGSRPPLIAKDRQ